MRVVHSLIFFFLWSILVLEVESTLRVVREYRYDLQLADQARQGELVFRPESAYTYACDSSVCFVGRVTNPEAQSFVFSGHIDARTDLAYLRNIFMGHWITNESIIDVAVFSGGSENADLFKRVCAELAAIPCAKVVLSEHSRTDKMFIKRNGEIGDGFLIPKDPGITVFVLSRMSALLMSHEPLKIKVHDYRYFKTFDAPPGTSDVIALESEP